MSNEGALSKIAKKINKYPIIKHLILIALFLLTMIFLTLLWLKLYTNHGQKLEMPDFSQMEVRDARKLADKNSFNLIVTDSIFLVGVQGGLIQNQNPKAGSQVKEGRKVYVTSTKYNPDKILVKDLPTLYGSDFSQKQTELGYRGLKSVIKDRKYDSGEPNHILEVYYKGKLIINSDVIKENVKIDVGETLEFVVSDKSGGQVTIPNLVCTTLLEARFYLESAELNLGNVIKTESIDEEGKLFIISQNPPYDGVSKIEMGKDISVTVSTTRPADCN